MDTHPPPARKAALIVNARSRRGRKLFRKAQYGLAERGVELIRAVPLRDPRALGSEIGASLDAGARLIIIGGGDGSVSGAVDHLVGRDCALGVLPLGTANSFARTLCIPLDLDGAMDVIAAGHFQRIDLGRIDQDHFANVAAIGMPSLIGATVPDGLKRIFGRLGYMVWAVWRLLCFRPFGVTITRENGEALRFDAVELRVANGSYLGGTEVTEEAEVDSGDIVIQVVTGGGRLSLGWNWLATALKLPQRRRTTQAVRGARLKVETHPSLPISIDGEVTARTPFTASVAQAAIDVVSPVKGSPSLTGKKGYPNRSSAARSRSASAERTA